MKVRETLLHNAKDAGLQFARQAHEIILDFSIHVDSAALAEFLHAELKGRGETNFIEQRRV